MALKRLCFVNIFLSLIILSCKSEAQISEPIPFEDIQATQTTTSPSIITEPHSEGLSQIPEVEFNPSSSTLTPPDDILLEITYFPGGGGAICPYTEKPMYFTNQVDFELFSSKHLDVCGWKENEAVKVIIFPPDGDSYSQQVYASNEDSGIYFVRVKMKFDIGDPLGIYKYVFEGKSGRVEVNVNLHEPDGARIIRLDDARLLLYGFKPSETINLYYYYKEEFSSWAKYEVNQSGQLIIKIPSEERGSAIYFENQYFVAIGKHSGEAQLLFDSYIGPMKLVMQESIIWSCGNLRTRLSLSSIARVAYTDGSNMRIRETPGFDGKIIDTVPEGTEVSIAFTDEPMCIDNVTWWKISSSREFREGWMAEYSDNTYWLEPIP